MEYIVHRRFKKLALCGEVNIAALSICEKVDNIIAFNGKPICYDTSNNAHDYFARNDDGNGLKRGKLIHSIKNTLERRDENYQTRWDKVWNDSICQKYKRKEHSDHWLWNHDFFNAKIEDLEHIARLVGARRLK